MGSCLIFAVCLKSLAHFIHPSAFNSESLNPRQMLDLVTSLKRFQHAQSSNGTSHYFNPNFYETHQQRSPPSPPLLKAVSTKERSPRCLANCRHVLRVRDVRQVHKANDSKDSTKRKVCWLTTSQRNYFIFVQWPAPSCVFLRQDPKLTSKQVM